MRFRAPSGAAGLILLLLPLSSLEAQVGGTRSLSLQPVQTSIAAVPFGPGERAEYQVKMGIFNVGRGHMEVHGVESVRGFSTYRVSMGIRGGRLGLRVRNLYQSWIDIRTLASRRFIQDQNEIRTERFRQFEFFPEEMRYERTDIEESGELGSDLPLDDISFVYFARTLPLEVGETYVLQRYFQKDRNPVVLEVLRREEVTVPAGTFQTIVVRPTIKTSGIFGEGGEAEVYFTDDDRRIMVMMRARMPVLRSISLHLTDITYARPLQPLSGREEDFQQDDGEGG
jgi:hypothetical protein